MAIDIENEPSTGRFLHAHLYSEDPSIDLHFTDKFELHNWLLAQWKGGKHRKAPFVLVGFNFGYDMPFLIEITDDKSAIWVDSRLITAKLTNGIRLLDLCNHVEGSLADWIGWLNMESKYNIKKESLDNLELRNRSDTIATYHLCIFLQKFYNEELHIPFKLTIGSCSFTLFASQFFDDKWIRTNNQQWINDYERQALRGGRTECFERGEINHLSFDVNSTYLSIMHDYEFPDPKTATYVEGDGGWEEQIRKTQGIYHCRVLAPESKIMVLPYVDPKQGKLIFPCGEFEGFWTSAELLEAIQQGYSVVKMYNYLYYKRSYPYFKQFAQFVWSQRKIYKKLGNIGMDKMIKKIGNTCYGKLGQMNAIGGFWGKLVDYTGIITGKETIRMCDGIEYITVPPDGKKDAMHSFPCIPVFVASYARLKLFQALKANEGASVYCDTDSIKLHGQPVGIAVGKELGDWGFEGQQTAIFYKPKWYGSKCKGVPKRGKEISRDEAIIYAESAKRPDLVKQIKEAIESAFYTFDKPRRFKEAIKSGKPINQWLTMLKILSKNDDKRIWIGDLSRPLKMVYNE